MDENPLSEDEPVTDEGYRLPEYQQRDFSRQNVPYQNPLVNQPLQGHLAPVAIPAL